MYLYYILGGIAALAALYLLLCFVCFRLTFYARRRRKVREYDLPPGKIYEPYHDQLRAWIDMTRTTPHEDLYITSRDGLRLHAAYYECDPAAPCEIIVHGYRGSPQRDTAAGLERCFQVGHNVLLVDQRTAGKSEGRVISFGAREQYDCLAWIDAINQKRGMDKDVILAGVSMGAATVMLACAHPLPSNVKYVLADCGYSSARDIIRKVVRENLHLPNFIFYPMIRMGGLLFGGFDANKISPARAVANATVPMIFIHGKDDGFVPAYMSERCYDACNAPYKKLLLVRGANHGLSLVIDPDGYYGAIKEMRAVCGWDK